MPLLCRNPLAQGVRNERQTDRKRKEMGESGGRVRKAEKRKKTERRKMGRQLSEERKSTRGNK